MDVNSTIVCNDSVQNKALSDTLLSTLFDFMVFRATEPFDFTWESFDAVKITKEIKLKALVKQINGKNQQAYAAFWRRPCVQSFYDQLVTKGKVVFLGAEEQVLTGKLSIN